MKKMITKYKDILFLLCLFMIIQPFLDIKPLFDNPNLSIFGITIPTIVRTLFILFIGLVMFYKNNNRKEKVLICIYLAIICVYTLCHHLIAKDNLDIPINFSYSFMSECFYIIRMLLPLILVYITKSLDLTYDKFINVILYSAIIIGIVIIVGDTLLISYTSYGSTTNITAASWLAWIFGDVTKYSFAELTSKGWFYMANQVSGLALLLLPFCLNDLIKNINRKNILATFTLTFAMILLGTRTSSYGWIIVYGLLVIISILLNVVKLIRKLNYKALNVSMFFLTIFLFLLLVSPVKTREFISDKVPSLDVEEQVDDVSDFIKLNYPKYGIQKIYIEDLYSYLYDSDFWLDVFDKSHDRVLDNREIETLISKRIISKNKGIKYDLFGYSFSRMRNGQIYIEKDFIAQRVTIGYIGILLLICPLIFIIGYIIYRFIKLKKLNLDFITFLISMSAIYGSSLFTGHILDELFITLYIAFIIGYYLILVGDRNEKEIS